MIKKQNTSVVSVVCLQVNIQLKILIILKIQNKGKLHNYSIIKTKYFDKTTLNHTCFKVMNLLNPKIKILKSTTWQFHKSGLMYIFSLIFVDIDLLANKWP